MLAPFTKPSLPDDERDAMKRKLAALAEIEAGGGDISGMNLEGEQTGPRSALIPGAARTVVVPSQPQQETDSGVAGVRDSELEDAKNLDSSNRANRLFEAATRQLIGGLTRTTPAAVLTQQTTAAPDLIAKRRQMRLDALKELETGASIEGRKLQAERNVLLDKREADRYADAQRERTIDNERADRNIASRDRNTAMMQGLAFGAASRAAAGEERAAKAEGPKAAAELRKEFNQLPDVKTFGEVDAAYQKVKAASSDPSAAGDLSAIFAYMKMLDPGSSVREGEFANAQNAGGIDAKISAAYNNVLNGQRLTPEQRRDFVGQAEKLYRVHLGRRDAQAKRYGELAAKQGLAPADVTGLGDAPQSASGKIRVTNGQQVMEIDASDEEEAARDGFKRVK